MPPEQLSVAWRQFAYLVDADAERAGAVRQVYLWQRQEVRLLFRHMEVHTQGNPYIALDLMLMKLKTTIEVPETLWNAFATESIKREKRSGKRNAIICKMIALYNDGKLQVKA